MYYISVYYIHDFMLKFWPKFKFRLFTGTYFDVMSITEYKKQVAMNRMLNLKNSHRITKRGLNLALF